MNKELFKKYAEIKNSIKELTENAKLIEAEVFEEMNKQEVEQVKSDFGTFSITKRKTWKYTSLVDTKEEEVKALKKLQEQDGSATFEEKQSLMFRGTKNETATNN